MTPCHVEVLTRAVNMTPRHVQIKSRPAPIQPRPVKVQTRTASIQLRAASHQTRTASHQPRDVNAFNVKYLPKSKSVVRLQAVLRITILCAINNVAPLGLLMGRISFFLPKCRPSGAVKKKLRHSTFTIHDSIFLQISS